MAVDNNLTDTLTASEAMLARDLHPVRENVQAALALVEQIRDMADRIEGDAKFLIKEPSYDERFELHKRMLNCSRAILALTGNTEEATP